MSFRNTSATRPTRAVACLALGLTIAAVAGCGGGGRSDNPPAPPALSDAAKLGEQIFADTSLSASGKMACATCHDPAFAHAQSNALPVQSGGANLDVPGFRAVPSLNYLERTPSFFFASDGTPTGGFNRDARSNTLTDQAERPFLAPHEMANGTAAEVVAKLENATYAAEFQRVFGSDVFNDADTAFLRMRQALERYQREDPDFHPYNSKYDAFLDLCGAFKVPTLRNIATRKVIFHNGAFTSLKKAITFYVQRDTNPESWYPAAPGGGVDQFNDMPPDLTRNVNTIEVPYNRREGEAPALSDSEIDDLISFLQTLTDGYTP